MTSYGESLPTVGGSNDSWGTENNALWTAAPKYTERLQGNLVINAPTDGQEEFLVFHSRFDFAVKRVAYQCFPSGTATLAVKINTTNVGGLSALSATASKQTADASSGNSVSVGDYVTVTPTSIDSAVERIVISVWGDRTDEGTAVT